VVINAARWSSRRAVVITPCGADHAAVVIALPCAVVIAPPW